MNNQPTENYYKILGTTAKIDQEKIKEKYIKAVKKYPPESNSEMFEKVRTAYETLKDPAKRKEYDLSRKYGKKLEDVFAKAMNNLQRGNYTQAQILFEKALSISPSNIPSSISLIQIAVIEGDLQKASNQFQRSLGNVIDKEELCKLYNIYARILSEVEYYEEAMEVLIEGKNTFPDDSYYFDLPRAAIYVEMDENAKAWDILIQCIPNQIEQKPEHNDLLLSSIHLLIRMEKWDQKEIIRKKFRKFIQNMNEEVRREVFDLMISEYEHHFDEEDFLGAEVFIDFAKMVTGNDSDIREKHQEVKKMAQVQKELLRMEDDENAFPLLFIRTMEWFYTDTEELYYYINSIPAGFMASLEDDKEEYAVNIILLRKKYPAIYNQFKKKWDDLFADLTKGFNREMKRQLLKVK
ncbi:DnaJ domain-containing protein [Paenisporosarcina sp. TG20]|uniref:J domain-containing protein n=1 Tax=Paenisporosarcina sp. TG20 TaxID=1211706 RepID=UPI0002EE90F1|nr:DnaJ domain-containing protein [Paenisporosarcina sp. TG20]